MQTERWQKIKQICEAAVERDESERAAFLDQACAGDEELRREAQSLLAYANKIEYFIETPALDW